MKCAPPRIFIFFEVTSGTWSESKILCSVVDLLNTFSTKIKIAKKTIAVGWFRLIQQINFIIMITLAVTVIKLITLRPLLEDRGHITKQSSVCHTHFCVRYSIKYFGEAVSRHSPAAPRGNCPALVMPLSCGPVLAVLVPLLSRPSSRSPGTATLRAGRTLVRCAPR